MTLAVMAVFRSCKRVKVQVRDKAELFQATCLKTGNVRLKIERLLKITGWRYRPGVVGRFEKRYCQFP